MANISKININSIEYEIKDETARSLIADLSNSGSGSSVELDTTLTVEGKAADAKAVGDALNNLGVSGLTTAQINALDGIIKIASFTIDPTSAYETFKIAFGISSSGGEDESVDPGEPPIEVTLTNISATYTGDNVAVGTAVTDLTGIVVTAHYSDGTSKTVTGYTLSGTIVEGENIVTVIYDGKMTEFTVVGIDESSGDDGGEVVMLRSITGDGASWVDTEVLPETNHRYEISATLTGNPTTSSPEYFVGCDMYNVNGAYGGFLIGAVNTTSIMGTLNRNTFSNVGTWNTADANLLTNKQAYFVIKDGFQAVYLDADYTTQQSNKTDGTAVWGSSVNTEAPIIPIHLFHVNYNSQTNSSNASKYIPTATKIFWFKIYEESTNELLHEFLPAKQGNKIGMYDTVTGEFHENMGTGTFAYEEVAA